MLKILSKLSCNLDRIWVHLTLAHFCLLERCFTLYMKRVLCLPKGSRSRPVYVLTGCEPILIVVQRRLRMLTTSPLDSFLVEWKKKVYEAHQEVERLDVFLNHDLWSGPACENRHVFTRFICHGYHHLLCSSIECYGESPLCICRYCSQNCVKYHAIECPELEGTSLHALARMTCT